LFTFARLTFGYREAKEYTPAAWEQHEERALQAIERQLDAQYGKEDLYEEDDDNVEEQQPEATCANGEIAVENSGDANVDPDVASVGDGADDDALYCVACEKSFKTVGSMQTHERSRKHRDMVAVLKTHMHEDDVLLLGRSATTAQQADLDQPQRRKGKKKKKNKQKESAVDDEDSENEAEAADGECVDGEAAALPQQMEALVVDQESTNEAVGVSAATESAKTRSGAKQKKKTIWEDTSSEEGDQVDDDVRANPPPDNGVKLVCEKCKADFSSKNKLMSHLKETGHATLKTLVPKSADAEATKQSIGDRKMARRKKR